MLHFCGAIQSIDARLSQHEARHREFGQEAKATLTKVGVLMVSARRRPGTRPICM